MLLHLLLHDPSLNQFLNSRKIWWCPFYRFEFIVLAFEALDNIPIHENHIHLGLPSMISISHNPRCRYTSGRTHLTPWGNVGYKFVKMGNVLASRVVFMCMLAAIHGLRFVVEQPAGSFLEDLPCYQWLWGTLKVAIDTYTTCTYLWVFVEMDHRWIQPHVDVYIMYTHT